MVGIEERLEVFSTVAVDWRIFSVRGTNNPEYQRGGYFRQDTFLGPNIPMTAPQPPPPLLPSRTVLTLLTHAHLCCFQQRRGVVPRGPGPFLPTARGHRARRHREHRRPRLC